MIWEEGVEEIEKKIWRPFSITKKIEGLPPGKKIVKAFSRKGLSEEKKFRKAFPGKKFW